MEKEYLTTEKKREWQRNYYRRNRDALLEKSKEYKERNREKIDAYQKRYGMTHDRREYYRQYNLKRKQMRLAAERSTG